jgi:hypothetical protein
MQRFAWLLFFVAMAPAVTQVAEATLHPAAQAQSTMQCYCRAQGRIFAEGEMACLRTAQGNRMARCEMVTNVMSWGITEAPCPQS